MYRIVTIIIFAFIVTSVSAETNGKPDPLFQNDGILPVTITAPFRTLVRERPKDEYLPGVFEYMEPDGTAVRLDLKIRTRGNFRHKNCKYPPLTLNLKKSQARGTLFDEQDKLKLVIPCEYSDGYEQIILREYLAYRILNTVTNMSFRVRLLHVKYVNTETQRDVEIRYGFLIEHKKRLAKRHDRNVSEIERTSVTAIEPTHLNLTSVFAFLIGNTDFSPIAGPPDNSCCHNYVLLGNDRDLLSAVPYDFDQSGFVDAPYAEPSQRLRIQNVRQRVYRGRCANNEHVAASLLKFRDHRSSIYALVNEQEGLEPRVRKRLVRYIDEFYDLIDDPKDVQRKLLKKCV